MATWTLAASLTTLRHEVDAAFPGRSKISDGTIGDTAHAARVSDHNPDAQGVVRAWDCTRDVVGGVDVADYLAEWLRRVKDPRVKYLIFKRRICSSYPVGGVAPYVWRPYDGLNAHEHHLHISVQPRPVGDDGRPWGFSLASPPLEEDVPLTDTEKNEVAALAAQKVLATVLTSTGWQKDGSYNKDRPVPLTLKDAVLSVWQDAIELTHPPAAGDPAVPGVVDVQALAAAIAPLLPAAPTAEQVADVLAARLQQ